MRGSDKYSITIKWSDHDEDFIALCEEFPGLSAFGPTRQDALKEFEIVLKGFIDIYREDKEELPKPNVLK